jgi:glycosyltransferase involved in cell wall biosynthesis
MDRIGLPVQQPTTALMPGRLGFVTSTPFNVAGGSGTYVGIQVLRRALEQRKVCVEVHTAEGWLLGLTLRRILFNLTVARRLRAGGYDWVIGFDLDGFHYGRAKTAPYVASIKGVIADELKNEAGIVRALLGIQAACERVAVRRADVVVATSRYSRDRIVQAYGVSPGKILIVPEPIDLAMWAAAGPHEREVPVEPPAVLTVAHMYPRKNLGALLRAYAWLRQAGVPFQGWLVGDGPCRQAWERLGDTLGLRGQVSFLGTISRRELVQRYRAASLFCLPSRQEGFGIVFLEAMASGLPIVGARAAAVPETVAEGEVGLLADPDDPVELAEALRRLLEDAALRRTLGEAGRRRVERYRAERVAELFLRSVRDALADAVARPAQARAPGATRTDRIAAGGIR